MSGVQDVWQRAIKISKHEAQLLIFFKTKNQSKQTIVFKISDVFDVGRSGLTKEVRGLRRSMGMWLYLRMKHGPAKIRGFDIAIHTAIVPYRYIATRTEP